MIELCAYKKYTIKDKGLVTRPYCKVVHNAEDKAELFGDGSDVCNDLACNQSKAHGSRVFTLRKQYPAQSNHQLSSKVTT